jgi:hypothetical protein
MEMQKKTHGGRRQSAGRKRRGEAEKWRVKLWFETVAELLVGGMVSGRTLGDIILNAGEGFKLPSDTQKNLGSPEAWRWYQTGERTPKMAIEAVDFLLHKKGHPPVGWILTPAGQMQLSPVWFWPSSECSLGKASVERCAEMEGKFWKRLPGDGTLPEKAAYWGIIDSYFLQALSRDEIAWPPRTLVPAEVANILPREERAPFPHLFQRKNSLCSEIPEENLGLYYTEKDLIEIFQAWAMSPMAAEEDGEIWFYHLRCLPGSPFYRPSLASLEIEHLKESRERIKENEIREYFGLPQNTAPLI